MNDQNTLIKSAIAGLFAIGVVTSIGTVQAAEEAKEKCYGVAKAGQNDCSGANSKHSCAGQSQTDKDPNDWKYVAKGSCEKMGGKLKPAADMGKK
ncbi:MAG: DUF2282 domain-containing protein [Proteobacteria bacterium]|nr:DUF2282 domain-containing protein [Pseudomonadota bacterium]